MIWTYEDINGIHIELSRVCNASCPGCPRFLRNSPNVSTSLTESSVSFDNFKKWFPIDLLAKIRHWIFCGTHGDPFACKDLYEILEYVVEYSPGYIQINTNGSIRNEKYFEKIGNLFNQRKNYNGIVPERKIIFSVDGLEDTNHIYRRGVNWNKLWNNMLAYTKTGADADWDFLQFEHNKHQIDEIKKIAGSMNMTFILKNPFGVEDFDMPVMDKEYKLEYYIKNANKSDNPTYIPYELNQRASIPNHPIQEEGYIECFSFRNLNHSDDFLTEIYINALGQILPCCFVGGMTQTMEWSPDAVQLQDILEKIGNKNNLHFYSFKEIIESNYLNKVFSESWPKKSLWKCWGQCGVSTSKVPPMENLFEER